MKGLSMFNKPTPLWLSILILCFCFAALGGAATTLYSGSFSVVSGGTYTDTNATASRCATYNGSKQLVSDSAACTTLSNLSAVSPLSYNNGTGAFSISANPTFTTLTTTGLLTGLGVTAGTGTVKGASDGATNTYVPPVYTSGGAATASTVHAAYVLSGSITPTIVSCTAGGAGACDLLVPAITFSGAAAFNGTFIGCTGNYSDTNGTTTTGPIVGYFNGVMATIGYTGFSNARAFTYSLICWGT